MITYDEYKNLGYSAVPEKQFARFADMAEKAVKKFVKHVSMSEDIKRGLCEICDIYYAENQSGGRLAGFTNDGYREQYFKSDINKRVFEVIQLYFPRDCLFRGV
jgi:hypothetical protein